MMTLGRNSCQQCVCPEDQHSADSSSVHRLAHVISSAARACNRRLMLTSADCRYLTPPFLDHRPMLVRFNESGTLYSRSEMTRVAGMAVLADG